jgi:NAD(P)H-nitrite reductase large subunit
MSDRDMVICRCEEITLGEILDAIDEGFVTVNDIKRATRAGMGLCQGRSCARTIARLVAQKTGRPMEEILPTGARFPVRAERMGVTFEREEADETNS